MTVVTVLLAATLLTRLEGVDDAPRNAAIDSLSLEGPKAAVAALPQANWRGREAVIEALERMGSAGLPALMSVARRISARDTRRLAIRALGRSGDADWCDSVGVFLSGEDRGLAVQALGEIGRCDPAVAAEYLGDPDYDTRRRALIAYARCGGGDSVAVAARMLDDEHHGVRFAAVRLLGRSGEDGVRILVDRFSALTGPGKVAAVATLGDSGSPLAMPVLKDALADSDWALRGAAARALAQAGGERAAAALGRALASEKHPLAAALIRQALEQLGGSTSETDRMN